MLVDAKALIPYGDQVVASVLGRQRRWLKSGTLKPINVVRAGTSFLVIDGIERTYVQMQEKCRQIQVVCMRDARPQHMNFMSRAIEHCWTGPRAFLSLPILGRWTVCEQLELEIYVLKIQFELFPGRTIIFDGVHVA